MPNMTKEQEENEFKTKFGDAPSFDGHSRETLRLLKFCSCPAVMNMARWNKWRKDNPGIEINLSKATLSNAHLEGADLAVAYLEGVNLTGAHLEGANLTGAILNGANLHKASFNENTVFAYAKLNNVVGLKEANFKNIDLKFTEFRGTQLDRAHFENSNLCNTHFEGANLTAAHFESTADKRIFTKLSSTHFQGAQLFGAFFTNSQLFDVHFEQTNNGLQTVLKYANFKNVLILLNTTFKKADISSADFTNAELLEVNFEGAILRNAILEGTAIFADKVKTNIKGADFTGATVNAKTVITNCDIDEKTNFTMIGLDSAQIEPSLLSALKTNIRRIEWNKYYDEQGKSCWGKIKTSPIRLFWSLSDYGSNTARIFIVFFATSIVFTIIYFLLAYYNQELAVLSNLKITGNWLLNVISAFCFAVSTMVTLGFGGINVTIQECSPWATFCALFFVTLNLMIGYFILAVLVTRIGILFQSLAPEQKIKK